MKLKSYNKKRLRIIANLTTGNKILDIGCAAMPNPYLNKTCCTGYDIVKPQNNKIIYNEEIKGDVKDIQNKLHGKKFDTIICGELIEHLENPYQFLRNIHNLLKDSGKLILSTPNPLGFPVFICEIFQIKKFFYSNEHVYYFLPRWVERLLNKSGFKLKQIKPVGLWVPFFVLPFCPTILSYQLIYVAQKKYNQN